MQASIFKTSRSPYWQINLKRDGEKPERFSLKVRDKQVAEQLKAKYVKEWNQERAGMLPAKPLRDAAKQPLLEHLNLFIRTREAEGKDKDYLLNIGLRLRKLFKECGWKYLKDINADSFHGWRSKQNLTAKTLNHYLASMRTVLNWLKQDGKIPINPLETVRFTKKEGGVKRRRRAYSQDEMRRLLEKAPTKTHRLIIRIAILAGLRRNEIAQLRRDDLHLEEAKPYILLRSETVKNRRGKPHSLHPELATDLATYLSESESATGVLFSEMPSMASHRALLEAAGVPYVDAEGRFADFHSFRKTHGTDLYLAGVSQRTATEQMRLSSPKLLDDVYTEVALLPTAEAVAKLKGYGEYAKKCDKALVGTKPDQSVPVPEMDLSGETQPLQHESSSPLESNPVPISQEVEESCRARTRT